MDLPLPHVHKRSAPQPRPSHLPLLCRHPPSTHRHSHHPHIRDTSPTPPAPSRAPCRTASAAKLPQALSVSRATHRSAQPPRRTSYRSTQNTACRTPPAPAQDAAAPPAASSSTGRTNGPYPAAFLHPTSPSQNRKCCRPESTRLPPVTDTPDRQNRDPVQPAATASSRE